jgi:hypothetical protein
MESALALLTPSRNSKELFWQCRQVEIATIFLLSSHPTLPGDIARRIFQPCWRAILKQRRCGADPERSQENRTAIEPQRQRDGALALQRGLFAEQINAE